MYFIVILLAITIGVIMFFSNTFHEYYFQMQYQREVVRNREPTREWSKVQIQVIAAAWTLCFILILIASIVSVVSS